jgi:hypothetical protein
MSEEYEETEKEHAQLPHGRMNPVTAQKELIEEVFSYFFVDPEDTLG